MEKNKLVVWAVEFFIQKCYDSNALFVNSYNENNKNLTQCNTHHGKIILTLHPNGANVIQH